MTVQDFPLWPIQQPIFDELVQAFNDGHDSVFLQAPTGFGKTTIFTKIIAGLKRNEEPALIVAHTNEILDQIAERLNQYGIAFGYIASGYRAVPWETIQLCMIQTLKPLLMADLDLPVEQRRFKARAVIIDEAHHCVASNYDPLYLLPDCHIIQVSATPWRLDGQGFQHRATKLICAASLKTLSYTVNPVTGHTYLVPCEAYTVQRIDASKIRESKETGEVNESDAEKAIEDADVFGCSVSIYKERCPGVTFMVKCQSRRHADMMAKEFNDAGVSCKALHGKVSRAERKQIIKDFRAGKILGLAVCQMAGEGFDAPNIGAIFLAKYTNSLWDYLQFAGRGARGRKGKTKYFLFDHVGLVDKFGHPLLNRTWSLDGKVLIEDDDDYRQCEQCYMWYPKRETSCAHCGFTAAKRESSADDKKGIPTVNKFGMLVYVPEADDEPKPPKVERKATRGEIGKTLAMTNDIKDWMAWCKEKGYTSQFAFIQWNMKQSRRKVKEARR